jgi:competence protein ComEC
VLGAFAAGIAASLLHAPPPVAGAVTVAAACVAFVALVDRGRAGPAAIVLVVAAGAAGWTWGGARLAATAPPALRLPATVAGTLVLDVRPTPDAGGRPRARGTVERLAGRDPVPRGTHVLVDLPPGPAGSAPAGARVRVTGRLEPAADRSDPGWWHAYVARLTIAGRLRATTAVVVGRRGGVAGLRDGWRGWAQDRVAAGLAGDRAALVRGMALGGGAGLSPDAAQAFRAAGLWHLLAVSGQNVAVVALAALAGLRALGVGRRPAVVVAGLLLAAYCLACDGGASVARAGVAGGLGVLAELRSGARERWYVLLAGLAGLLAVQPRSLGDPGLQLSFAAVVGLFAVAPTLVAWLRGWLPVRLAELAGLTLGAGLATAPVLVWNFGRLSLVGLIVNVAAVPMAGPVVVLALAGLVVGAVVPAAGLALTWIAGLGADLLLLAARAAARVPGATVEPPSAAAVGLIALAAAPPVVGRWLRRPRRPRAARRRPVAALLAAGATVAVAAGVPLPGGRGAPPWPATPAVTTLDVGEGDAILLRGPGGAAALVDGGPPGPPAPVLAALRRQGVRRLDAVLLTHGDRDHVGGVPEVLAHERIGIVVRPPLPPSTEALQAITRAAAGRRVPVRSVLAGASVRVGVWRLRVLWPDRPPPAGTAPNDAALVVLASAGRFDALLAADAESPVLLRLPLRPVEVLKVAHHASADPGLPSVLRRLRPAEALVSVGPNPYGHPVPATLAALRAAGSRVWRTDRSGDVTVRAAPGGDAVETGS